MPALPTTTLSTLIDGDDLVAVRVRVGPFGARAEAPVRIANFLAPANADAARRALAPLADGARVTLTVPAEWTGVRPIALTSERWRSAREEVVRSIQSLFPMSADDAMVGLIDRVDEQGRAVSGALVAAERSRVDPWRRAVETAAGRPVHAVLPVHAAFQGLGLQSIERSEILERLPGGPLVVHRLIWGRLHEIAAPFAEPAPREGRRLVLDPADSSRGEVVQPEALAIGAALAPVVAPRSFWPLEGPLGRAPRRWLVPVAAAVGAAALLWAASSVSESRYARAAEALEAKQASLNAAYEDAQRAKSEAIRLALLLRKGAAEPVASWRSVMPDLAVAQSVVPDDGFIYRLDYDTRSVTITGEAKRASDVLKRLEDTDAFSAARTLGASTIVEERGTEQFSIRADRVGFAVTPAATGPGGRP